MNRIVAAVQSLALNFARYSSKNLLAPYRSSLVNDRDFIKDCLISYHVCVLEPEYTNALYTGSLATCCHLVTQKIFCKTEQVILRFIVHKAVGIVTNQSKNEPRHRHDTLRFQRFRGIEHRSAAHPRQRFIDPYARIVQNRHRPALKTEAHRDAYPSRIAARKPALPLAFSRWR